MNPLQHWLPSPPSRAQRNFSAAPDAAPVATVPKAGERRQRAFVLGDRAKMKLDEEARTIEVSFSSEEPVERYWGVEILDHASKSCDLSRLKSAGPVLMDHDRRDQVGVVEKVWLDNKVGRALLRFSKGARGQEVWTDILDGIRRNVSVSYSIDKIVLESEDKGVSTYRIQGWCPDEISIVSVPADTSVGVGRAGDPAPATPPPNTTATVMNRQRLIAALTRAGVSFNPTDTDEQLAALFDAIPAGQSRAAAPPATGQRAADVQIVDEQRVATAAATRERERITAIQSLYHQHRGAEIDKDGKVLTDLLADGRTLQDTQNWILQNRYKAQPLQLDPNIGMSEGDIKQYSLVRVLNRLANKQPLDGLEMDASNAVMKRVKREPQGFFIPHDVAARGFAESKGIGPDAMTSLARSIAQMAQQRALTAGVATAGGYLVNTDVLTGSLIELLRAKALVMQLGARNLSGLIGDVAIPRHTGGATTYWLDETATATLSQQTFGQLALTPHRLAAATAYSKQLLAQASIDVEGFVRQDLMTVLAIEKDRACLNGLNAAGEPLGIINTTGIGAVTFGAAATRAKAIEFQEDVASANAALGSLAYLTTYATAAKWLGIDEASSTAQWLWKGNIMQGQVVGLPAFASTQVPSNKVVFGNWNDLIVADWDGIDVVVDPYTLATAGQVQIVVMILTDNGIRHAGSFSVSSDSGAQ